MDTGDQVKYVVDLAKALGRLPEIDRVDLFTRLIEDPLVDADYSEPLEELGNGVRIVRIRTGAPEEYVPKEELWDRLDAFADNAMNAIHQQWRLPDILHSHYADAAYVGGLMAHQLGVPLIHTGHSLGRSKRRQLLAMGMTGEEIEDHFNMSRQIDAEEAAFVNAQRIIAGDRQEIEDEYRLYENFRLDQMRVMPPGIDLERFFPPTGEEPDPPVAEEVRRFLHDPDKPVILSLSPPMAQNNLGALVSAYGESRDLQKAANLVIFAGERDDIMDMEIDSKDFYTDLLLMIDLYDLYGKVAYPKQHKQDDIPQIYRFAAASGGVLVDPALTEPSGSSLIEAAASGLPIVATEDPVSQDIIAECDNGLLIDPSRPTEIAGAILRLLEDRKAWQACADNGVAGAGEHHSWGAHSKRYLQTINNVLKGAEPLSEIGPVRTSGRYRDRVICTGIDQNLLGDPDAIPDFVSVMRANRSRAYFAIATGRRLESALNVLRQHDIPEPDLLITSGGTEIYYAPRLTPDRAWAQHIDHSWTPHVVRRVLDPLPGLELQPRIEQSRFKISYYIDPEKAPSRAEITRRLNSADQSVSVIMAFGQYLDILPSRASKGFALRYVSGRWGIPLDHILAAGGSGADEDLMRGSTLAAVVANRHEEELSGLVDLDRIYFARQSHARGILEAIEHYDFFGALRAPVPDSEPEPCISGAARSEKESRLFLCTDLDRTLIPNGPQPESPQARDCFAALASHPNVRLAYVSGRHHDLVQDAIVDYGLPVPDYAITDVGTKIYDCKNDWREVTDWADVIARDWAGHTSEFLAGLFADMSALRLQGPSKQSTHKLSYYVSLDADRRAIDATMTSRLNRHSLRAGLVWSTDETAGVGLLDVLPEGATKLHAVEFLAERLGYDHREVVFSGDSGNDLQVMASPISSVLVANAFSEVREAALTQARDNGNEDSLYLAEGTLLGMNGNYGAGIVEGVVHFHPHMRSWIE